MIDHELEYHALAPTSAKPPKVRAQEQHKDPGVDALVLALSRVRLGDHRIAQSESNNDEKDPFELGDEQRAAVQPFAAGRDVQGPAARRGTSGPTRSLRPDELAMGARPESEAFLYLTGDPLLMRLDDESDDDHGRQPLRPE